MIAGITNTILPNTVASFSANSNSYVQLTLQNISNLSDSTVDFIATADNGDDNTNYIDMGIIGSGYDNQTPTNSLGNIVFGGDGYLYSQGNLSNTSQAGGNLAIGTTTSGKSVKIFAGGVNTSAIVATISSTGVAITGTLSATGNANVGNLSTAGAITATGNVTAGNLSTGGVLTATGNISGGNISTAGALSVTGNANVGNLGAATGVFTTAVNTVDITSNGIANLGTIANVKISGGTTGQIIQTDGAGNLSFVAISTSSISNGTSNVSIPAANGNVNISVGGQANRLIVTSTGANITGTANITGQLVVGGDTTLANTTVNGTILSGNIFANTSTIQGNIVAARDLLTAGTGIAKITGTIANTTSTSSGQVIASVVRPSDAMGVRFTVVSNDGTAKSQLQYVDVISMGSTVDFTITGPAPIGGSTGSLTVTWSGGNSTILLNCTPASSNTTTWSTTINYM